MSNNDDPRPIVIVGAGVSGLTAARALHNADQPVIVFEARDRIGGRTHTAKVGEASVDLGAAWIHGVRNNPAAEFADASGLAHTAHDYIPRRLYDSEEGQIVGLFDSLRVLGVTHGFTRSAESINDDLGDRGSFADAIGLYLDEVEATGALRRRSRFVIELLASASSGPMDDLSLAEVLDLNEGPEDEEVPEPEGDDHVIAGGYIRLVEALADGLDIRTGAVVEQVAYSEDGASVVVDGETIEASSAIVTVPLGVLKDGAIIKFSPELPKAKQDAIARLGFGAFEKVVLVFDERCWTDVAEKAFAYLGGVGAQRRFPMFIDMTEHAGAPTLVCIYSGRFAQEAQASKSDQDLIDDTMAVLREVLGAALLDPVAARVTRWSTDPFSLGSYSYMAVGSSQEDMRTLAEPVGGTLLFAGEATIADASATVHGALMSGLREAQRLVPGADIFDPSSPGQRHSPDSPWLKALKNLFGLD